MKKDFLKRDKIISDLKLIVDRLSRMKRGSTFALDGSWGSGKSFLLNMFKESILQTDNKYFIVEYDCWKYDFYSEPVIAILFAIREQVETEVHLFSELKDNEVVTGALSSLRDCLEKYGGKVIESKLGFNPIEIYNGFKENGQKIKENSYKEDSYYSFKEILKSIRDELQKIAENRTIIFIVDELDRCLPEYGISVLERLHHFFSDIPNFITILAIDKQELCKVVEHAYGNEFNVDAYLKKIIDFYFVLNKGEIDEHYMEKYETYKNKFVFKQYKDFLYVENIITVALKGTTIREQEKLFLRAELIHDMITKNNLEISCMLFEVLSLRFNTIEEIRDFLLKDNEYDVFLNTKNINGKRYSCLESNVLHKTLWFIENIENEETKGCCGQYYLSDYEDYKKIVDEMKLFDRLKKIVCF